MTGREQHWEVEGRDVKSRVEESLDHGTFHLEEQSFHFRIIARDFHGGWIELEGKPHRFFVLREKDRYTVWLDGRIFRLRRIEKGQLISAGTPVTGLVRSLMPGKIVQVCVGEGDAVSEKQTVIVMESMKMETPLHAPRAGRVAAVRCQAGQNVDMGETLLEIE